MTQSKVWIIGNRGMLGTELSELFVSRGISFTGTDREVDITNQDALNAFTAEYKPEYIVNCAAYTAVDKAEDDRELCRALNADGAGNIARAANRAGARLVHISTDYVFNGNGTRPYREDDPTDPTGVYGLTKRDGEVFVLQENPESWIIRTAWLYGQHGNNFVHTMLRLMGERDELRVVNDQFGSPTWAHDLAGVVADFIVFSEAGTSVPFGIYHYSNGGEISWFDFAREIFSLGKRFGILDSGRNVTILPCSSAEFPAKVRRPPYSVLDKSKIESVLGKNVPGWKESLSAYIELYANKGK